MGPGWRRRAWERNPRGGAPQPKETTPGGCLSGIAAACGAGFGNGWPDGRQMSLLA
jgi:hypothetical protein